jgi:hypothetical protein
VRPKPGADLDDVAIEYANISQCSASPPAPRPQDLAPGISLLTPLTRDVRVGSSLIALTVNEDPDDQLATRKGAPLSQVKWAEEASTVVEIRTSAPRNDAIAEALEGVTNCEQCDFDGKVGVVGTYPTGAITFRGYSCPLTHPG